MIRFIIILLLLSTCAVPPQLDPEILLQTITVEDNSCIPNLTLSLNSISTYDQYQWYYNGDPIAGANSINYTPSEPGYYQISGSIENCPGAIVSENIPVSACPNDFDNDGVNDNIDIPMIEPVIQNKVTGLLPYLSLISPIKGEAVNCAN